ncbi:MAG: InlB B-repeat-containing protein, partial [Clostridia bacterium]|nr:InlB B-repeat-containing protein [Clostridia bacterium]
MTPFFITLHLDPNGGSISEGTVDIKAGGSYGLLPSAYREGYIFAGWFTDPEGGEQIISSDMPVSEEEHTLYAHWIKKKADKKSKYSRNKAQKKVIITLAVMTVVLSIVWAVVNHIVGITTYEDVDGTKYKIMKKDGVYVVCDRDGYTLDLTTDGYYITDASTLLEVDEETGEVEQYAIVDTEGNVVVGSNRRILIFPHTAKASIDSITVNNDYGTYTFYRDKDGNFQIRGYEGTSFDPELFSSLVVSTGYTLSMQKLAEPRFDENGKLTEYGLCEEERTDEEGNTYLYKPATYTLVDISGNKYEMIIGDPIVSGAGYYAQYKGRDAVYILSNELAKTLLEPIESLVTPMVVYPMTLTTYFDVDNFTLMSYDYEGAAAAGVDLSKENKTPEEEAAAEKFVDIHTSFTYIDLTERENTERSSIPYIMSTISGLDAYDANSINIDQCLQSFYNMTFLGVKKLGLTEKALRDYDLEDPRYVIYLDFQDLEHWIYISDMTERGTYYMACDLFNMVVEVDRSNLPYLHWSEFDWVESGLLQLNLAFVDHIKIQSPRYNVTFKMDNSASDQSKTVSSSDIVITADVGAGNSAQPVDTENFRDYYKTLLYASMEGLCELTDEEMAQCRKLPDSEADLVMTVKSLSGRELVYRFYQYTERKAYMTI